MTQRSRPGEPLTTGQVAYLVVLFAVTFGYPCVLLAQGGFHALQTFLRQPINLAVSSCVIVALFGCQLAAKRNKRRKRTADEQPEARPND
jgi:hypothetical protein